MLPTPGIWSGVAVYRTLKAWQHAQSLAIACAKAARSFPEYEQHALADQLRRNAYAVPLNIAAGNTRQGQAEYRRALETARAALAEVESILGVARELAYLSPADFGRLEALAIATSKTLFGLHRKIAGSSRQRNRLL